MCIDMDSKHKKIDRSIDMAGMLFSSDPDIGSWEQTRAAGPEIVAFTNKKTTPQFDRLAIEFFEEDETDEDGYTYSNDTWSITIRDRGEYRSEHSYPPEETMYHEREHAVLKVIEIMENVTDSREK
jgi:hypothetical protein